MFRHHFDDLKILDSDTLVAHVPGHAEAFEDLCGIRAGADGTGCAESVVLAVGRLSHAAETVALHNALETFNLACADNIDKAALLEVRQ